MKMKHKSASNEESILYFFVWFCAGALNATESEYEPVSDYELEGAVSDYEARSEFDDTDDWEKDKSMSKRSARVWLHNLLIYYLLMIFIYRFSQWQV